MDKGLLFTLLWLAWGVMFGAVEYAAIRARRRREGASIRDGSTLSEHVWWFQRRTLFRVPVGRLAFLAFWVWLTYHLLLGL